MIVNPEMLKTTGSLLVPAASSSVAPIPTVIPSPAITFQKAGDVGNRTLWYAASSSLRFSATDKLTQGCRRHNGSLLAGFLCHGLPCPSRKCQSSVRQINSSLCLAKTHVPYPDSFHRDLRFPFLLRHGHGGWHLLQQDYHHRGTPQA